MASVAMLIGGALATTLAFTSSSYLFSTLSKDSIDKERKRHDLAIGQLQKAQIKWYHDVFGHELPPLPREPVLSDYYTPNNEQHDRELAFIALSMIGIGGVLYYFER